MNQIELDDDVVRMRIDWMDSERIVYMDGRGHPENGERTLHGHCIGRWELALTEDRRHLRYDIELSDPEWLAEPITNSSLFDYHPELAPSGLPCDLEAARRFLLEP